VLDEERKEGREQIKERNRNRSSIEEKKRDISLYSLIISNVRRAGLSPTPKAIS
jgi:hypothetical protein